MSEGARGVYAAVRLALAPDLWSYAGCSLRFEVCPGPVHDRARGVYAAVRLALAPRIRAALGASSETIYSMSDQDIVKELWKWSVLIAYDRFEVCPGPVHDRARGVYAAVRLALAPRIRAALGASSETIYSMSDQDIVKELWKWSVLIAYDREVFPDDVDLSLSLFENALDSGSYFC